MLTVVRFKPLQTQGDFFILNLGHFQDTTSACTMTTTSQTGTTARTRGASCGPSSAPGRNFGRAAAGGTCRPTTAAGACRRARRSAATPAAAARTCDGLRIASGSPRPRAPATTILGPKRAARSSTGTLGTLLYCHTTPSLLYKRDMDNFWDR